jgi:hypothetical protein
MDTAQTCYFCGESNGRIVPWFVQTYRRSIHMPCLVAALRNADPEATESEPEQSAAA